MIIYIAGKMTGLPDLGRGAFMEAASALEKSGHTVINPAVLPTVLKRNSYMPICLAMLNAADAIFLLPGWEDSPGARLEHDYAVYHGKKVCGHGRWKPLLRSDSGKVLVWGHKECGCMVADKMLTCPECGADMRG